MKIGIDLRQLVIGASGGISQLVKGVCEHMFALYPEHRFLVFCTPFNRSLLDHQGENVRYFSLPLCSYFASLDQIAGEEKLDALFRAYPMEDTLRFPLAKQIVLIPDNQHETYPEFFSEEVLRTRRVAFAKALGGAGAIGTISEFARATLQDFPDTRCRDIFLMEPALQVVHGRGASLADLSEAEKGLLPEGDFFLFPANLWKHKNHRRLLEAFRLFLAKPGGHKVELILTGHPAGWQELSREFADLPVRHLGFIRPELLRVLLERARALAFFSLYEGFGIPLLEAFDAGTPVICSDTTSLPEVGGDAVLACAPTDSAAMAGLMERIVRDEALRAALIARGRERLKYYSWEKSAHSLMAACGRVSLLPEAPVLEPEEREPEPRQPLVSIVTPSYNQGRFLRRTIESVLTQSYPNIEYIVMDGGSSDESVDILESYGSRFHWVSEKDKGQTDAINKGMALAKGEILAYLNSDDVLLPGAIEKVVAFFHRNPYCDLVYGNADYIDEDDGLIGPYNTADYSFDRLIQDCMICQPAAFWRKSITDRIGPFDDRLNFVMDYDYWMRIAKSGAGIQFIPDKLACSRLYAETKTLSSRSKIYREIFVISRKHAGYVHPSFYRGYWHHLIYEKERLASRAIRKLPNAYVPLGWLHHKWDHSKSYTRKHAVRFLRRAANSVLHRMGVRPAVNKAIARLKPFVAKKLGVVGFYVDNWLADTVLLPPKKFAAGQSLHIAGVAPQPTTMTIFASGREVARQHFQAHQPVRVVVPSEAVNGRPVKLQFSSYFLETGGRRLAFLLQDTNIFAEQDTW